MAFARLLRAALLGLAAAMAIPSPAPALDLSPRTESSFITDIVEMNLVGAYIGQLAASLGSSQAVRALGTHLLNDHNALQQEALSLAKSANVDVPTTLTPSDLQAYKDLAGYTGQQFDDAFASRVIVLKKRQIQVLSVSTPAQDSLGDYARRATPLFQAHLAEAERLQAAH